MLKKYHVHERVHSAYTDGMELGMEWNWEWNWEYTAARIGNVEWNKFIGRGKIARGREVTLARSRIVSAQRPCIQSHHLQLVA